ncbi:2-dehydropantoate 2-reductase [Brevibacterium sp. R8603A2]|uniref:ketopantoate reductase family protein n=1 Tax=Brevibacterium sp. R8603A2 TaxID=2929779 RepID=UPI001FF936DB|nr:2-dehydropantoate 2-reductase [Brevibacterium sp. R8603A2]MCK1802633.1 2-dehydropantoate 2-reductase [Brevibacterium sp. R8603A2]
MSCQNRVRRCWREDDSRFRQEGRLATDISVLGAGVVGSFYGALLARAGHDVRLVARGPRAEQLRERAARAPRRRPYAGQAR